MPVPENPEELRAAVEDDVRAIFGDAFPGELSVPSPFAELLPIGTGNATSVPWQWNGVHKGSFHGLLPTGRPVEFAGITVLRDDGGDLLFHRLVDWLDLYRQIDAVGGARRTFEHRVDS